MLGIRLLFPLLAYTSSVRIPRVPLLCTLARRADREKDVLLLILVA